MEQFQKVYIGIREDCNNTQQIFECRFMQAGRFKFHELEDSGHWMQLEKPDEINKLILDFINEPSAKI